MGILSYGCASKSFDDCFENEVIASQQNIRGSIIDGRYYAEDHSFNVGMPSYKVAVQEHSYEGQQSLSLANSMGGVVRYDFFPITNQEIFKKIYCDTMYKRSLFTTLLQEVVLKAHQQDDPQAEIVYENMIMEDDLSCCYAFINATFRNSKNLLTKEHPKGHMGVLLTIKDNYLILINEMPAIPLARTVEDSKDSLLPSLLKKCRDCRVEDIPSAKKLDESLSMKL